MAEPEPVAEPEHESEPEQVAEQKRPPIPEAYMTSQSSVTRLSSTNGTVESDSLGMFQMTREEVADNGWTTWRILQKVDSDGSVPEYARLWFISSLFGTLQREPLAPRPSMRWLIKPAALKALRMRTGP